MRFFESISGAESMAKTRVERPPENLKTGSKTGRSYDRGGCIRGF